MNGIDLSKLSPADIKAINEYAGVLSYKRTWLYQELIHRPERVICLFTGNQFGKNKTIACYYLARLQGLIPIEKKNMRPNVAIRTIRCCSETLPNDPEGGEVKNTQYPALKAVIPHSWIKRDITIRKPIMTIRDPQGGADIIFEFVSYNQEVQAMAGVQRWSTWLDESAPQFFYQEQLPRLLAADGDLLYTLTPAEYMTWEFDELYGRAHTYIRTPRVVQRLKERFNQDVPNVQHTDSKEDIVVLMASTDDNPVLKPEVIEETMSKYSDPEVVDVRRYGIFNQVSGQIFKNFDSSVHIIDMDKFDGIPHGWLHARSIDFHEHVSWACLWSSLSPHDEMFIWKEYNPSPDLMTSYEISKEIALRSKDYKYKLDLIDPRSAIKQVNTNLSPIEDMNRYFYEFKHDGICTGGYWQTWDTKSTRGRDAIKERIKNARMCGKPFNNRRVSPSGIESYIPTLWISNDCRETIQSFRNWRWEEWSDRGQEMTKDSKDKPQMKWSHFPMAVEALLKHPGFSVGRYRDVFVKPNRKYYSTARI